MNFPTWWAESLSLQIPQYSECLRLFLQHLIFRPRVALESTSEAAVITAHIGICPFSNEEKFFIGPSANLSSFLGWKQTVSFFSNRALHNRGNRFFTNYCGMTRNTLWEKITPCKKAIFQLYYFLPAFLDGLLLLLLSSEKVRVETFTTPSRRPVKNENEKQVWRFSLTRDDDVLTYTDEGVARWRMPNGCAQRMML